MNENTLGMAFDARNNSMNIIRLIAALAVIYGHASAVTGHGPGDIFLQFFGYKFIGGVAVDIFFLLSGFLVTGSAMSGKGICYFFASRVLRVYPGLIFCMLLSVFLLGPSLTASDEYWHLPETWRYFFGNATAYQTIYFLPGVFSDLHDKAINGSLWSLQVEVRLYLLVGISLIIGVFTTKIIFNTIFIVAMILGYFSTDSFSILFGPENHKHVAMMFMIGSFAWVNRDTIPMTPSVLLALLVFAASLHGTSKFVFAYILLLPYFVFYIAIGKWGNWFNGWGDYSYGTYLYGWPCQQLVLMSFPRLSNTEHTFIAALFALSIAFLSWHVIEKPSLKLKERFTIKR
jgi:peptidoglycan/LPS O-acetylase OafA/YrhL